MFGLDEDYNVSRSNTFGLSPLLTFILSGLFFLLLPHLRSLAGMHDEANPGFVDMIDQTTLGHRFILDTFNVTPKTAWQIGE